MTNPSAQPPWHPALSGANLYPASLAGVTLVTAWLVSQYQANLLAVGLILNAVLIIRFRAVPLVFCLMALLMIFARAESWTLPPYPPLIHSISWLPLATVTLVLLSFRCCTFAPKTLGQLMGTTPPSDVNAENSSAPSPAANSQASSAPGAAGANGDEPVERTATVRRKSSFEMLASYLLLGWFARRVESIVRGLRPRPRIPTYRADESFRSTEATSILGTVVAVAIVSAWAIAALPAVDRHAESFSLQASGMRLVVLIVLGCITWSLANVGLNYFDLRNLSPLAASVMMRRELLQEHLTECRIASRAASRRQPARYWPNFRGQTKD